MPRPPAFAMLGRCSTCNNPTWARLAGAGRQIQRGGLPRCFACEPPARAGVVKLVTGVGREYDAFVDTRGVLAAPDNPRRQPGVQPRT